MECGLVSIHHVDVLGFLGRLVEQVAGRDAEDARHAAQAVGPGQEVHVGPRDPVPVLLHHPEHHHRDEDQQH